MTDQNREPRTVELWMRSFAPTTAGPNHERALERFDELESRDSIASVSVHVWGAAFERTAHRRRVPELERIEATLAAFERWAARTGCDLEPFFRTRQVDATFTNDSFVVCRLPTLELAAYRGDDLVHVAPSCDGERSIGGLDRLEALHRGGALSRWSRTTGLAPESPSGPTVNRPTTTSVGGSSLHRSPADRRGWVVRLEDWLRGNQYGYR